MPATILAGIEIGGDRPVRLVAVVNVSPESFYPASVARDEQALREAARRAVAEGADILDIGARSTAPYLRTDIPLAEEIQRMRWAVEILRDEVSVPLAVDSTRAAVAAAALAAGARIVNDVSGLAADPAMPEVAAAAEGVILVAAAGGPVGPSPLAAVRRAWDGAVERATRAGVRQEHIVVDPGIGFFPQPGMAPERFACEILGRLNELQVGFPILVGVSRKSFLGRVTGRADPADRLWGSLAATAVAVRHGAAAVRTHDVAATRDAVRVAEAIRAAAGRS